MSRIETVFATTFYRTTLRRVRNGALKKVCLSIAAEDGAGQRWSKAHAYRGYTSYASLDDLPTRAPEFAALQSEIDPHVRKFARLLDFETGRKKLELDSLWINVLETGGAHSGHIHPHAVISGTYYVSTPKGASAIRFEDPRLPLMMAAPARKDRARQINRSHISVAPAAGTLLLWESWLRHEVPAHQARTPRISVSFNYS
ncbi:MAG TPA: TIGR02466 family protein [Rhizomicrobium sp.]|nr:TIGR02466 family protein [Rhizomicrobium sp.]